MNIDLTWRFLRFEGESGVSAEGALAHENSRMSATKVFGHAVNDIGRGYVFKVDPYTEIG